MSNVKITKFINFSSIDCKLYILSTWVRIPPIFSTTNYSPPEVSLREGEGGDKP